MFKIKKKSGRKASESTTPAPPSRISTPTYSVDEVLEAQALYRCKLTACANYKDVCSVGLILKAICPVNCQKLFNLDKVPANKNWTTRRIRPDARSAFFGKNGAEAAQNDSGSTLSLEQLIEDTTGDIGIPTRQFLITTKKIAEQKFDKLLEANQR